MAGLPIWQLPTPWSPYRVILRVLDAVMSLTKPRGGFHGGALVVAASGNESKREQHPNWRIAASLPAANDEVIAVAAVGRRGDRLVVSDFSNSAALLTARVSMWFPRRPAVVWKRLVARAWLVRT